MDGDSGKRLPRGRDDRIILHFDYDCFYAQVVENRHPELKALPLGIKQKSILATCNYEARRRGVKKLMLISEAKRICPELVLADGEDLSDFRDVSKTLYSLLRSYSWNGRVERLGLDEVFFDATDIVQYNVDLLNHNSPEQSWFCLSRDDPENGFSFDATAVAGCTHGLAISFLDAVESSLCMRLLVASHLARYLRLKIEEQGYTSACGISTNKVLAKLAGNKNKPRNQTTLLSLRHSDVLSFMDGHKLRSVPGIGSKTTRVLEGHVLSRQPREEEHTMECDVTVGQVRTHPEMGPQLLEKLLGGPGSEKGVGEKIWGLLHGVENSEVKAASDVPTQISIEDTYKGLNTAAEIDRELRLLSASLLRRMHVDLVESDENGDPAHQQRWIAHPKTIRLTTRPKTAASDGKPYNWARASRSQPLPNFVFSFSLPRDQIVEKLATEVLLGMFSKLNPAKDNWNLGLINICVANMVLAGSDGPAGNGRDISVMFKKQEDVLRQWTAYDDETPPETEQVLDIGTDSIGSGDPEGEEEVDEWDDEYRDGMEACPICNHMIPIFALSAHDRYHSLGEE